jgi:ABC-type branched-subunit amino acid transport system substrate-binding protein
VLALVGAACTGEGGQAEEATSPAQTATATASEPAISFDTGVTREPCQGMANPDNGCIRLGTLTDLEQGPFAAFGRAAVAGQRAFWQRVNEQGGIAGSFDVTLDDHVEGTGYEPSAHTAAYERVSDEVAALAQTLGTPTTRAITDDMATDSLVGVPLSWWSGWAFEDTVLESGSSYCVDGMNAVDWAAGTFDDVETVAIVRYASPYGADAAAGVKRAAEANGLEVVAEVEQAVASASVDGAVAAIRANQPDLVFLATGPTPAAAVVAGASAFGYEGQFVGAAPTWNAILLETDAAEALLARYHAVGPHGAWTADTPAHQAMRDAFGQGAPENNGYTAGWMASYALKAVLEQAAAEGDLTRKGIAEAVEQTTVEADGALPSKRYRDDAAEAAQRSSYILGPSQDAAVGLTTTQEGFTGSTAAEADLSQPCADA